MFLIFISSKTYLKYVFIYKYNEALIHNQVYGGYMTFTVLSNFNVCMNNIYNVLLNKLLDPEKKCHATNP